MRNAHLINGIMRNFQRKPFLLYINSILWESLVGYEYLIFLFNHERGENKNNVLLP